jgi:hypothetical protein
LLLVYVGEPVVVYGLSEELNNQGAQYCSRACRPVISEIAIKIRERPWLCFTTLNFIDDSGAGCSKVSLRFLKLSR